MLLTGALQNCQQVPCESAVPSARACKRTGSCFCWIAPAWLCRARGAVKSRCSGCVDGEGSWGVEACAVLLLLVCGRSGAALGWRRVHGPENLSPVWYCWACPLPSPIQTLLPSSPRGPGVSDWCHLGVLNHLQLGNKAFLPPPWPAAARVVWSTWLQDKAVVLLEPHSRGYWQEYLECHSAAGVIGWCSFGGNCGFGCCVAYPWLESRELSRGSGQGAMGSCHHKQPGGIRLSSHFAEGQTGWKIERDSLMRFQPLLISVSAWALQGCAFLGDKSVLPWENCPYSPLHRWQHAQVSVWHPQVPQAHAQLCQWLCMDMWASWKCVPSVQS